MVDAAFKVHTALEPGLLETAYQGCLLHELQRRGLSIQREVPFPVYYAELVLDTGYRVDMVIEDEVLVENKAVQSIGPVHRAQLLTYLKLSNKRLG